MSTIASSRASGIASPPSSRSSLSLDRTVPASQRRNRTALRDYYNLKTTTSPAADSASQTSDTPTVSELDADADTAPQKNSELDRPDFSAQEYITALLAKTSLEGILQVESGLISDIRGFDGERKALVYDNYSKLISATETISRMRTEMDPLAPTVMQKLEPAVERIAGLAGEVSRGLVGSGGGIGMEESAAAEKREETEEAKELREKKVKTVKWVVGAPERFRMMVENGNKEEAEKEWEDVRKLLNKWEGVGGVEKVKEQAVQALNT